MRDMAENEEEQEEVEYDSGPYCEHWFDPWECEELCKCGHMCKQHPGSCCLVEGCPCEEFKDKE
jgi:hypothetical protein